MILPISRMEDGYIRGKLRTFIDFGLHKTRLLKFHAKLPFCFLLNFLLKTLKIDIF